MRKGSEKDSEEILATGPQSNNTGGANVVTQPLSQCLPVEQMLAGKI